MITFGDIINKPQIVLFPEDKTDIFYLNCKSREKEIKKAITLSFNSFNNHVQKLNSNRDTLSKWQKEKIKSCLTNLANYLEYLLSELDKKRIESHCKSGQSTGRLFIPFLPDLVLLILNSYQGAIETDLYWVDDFSMGDLIDISNGSFDFNKLHNYLPARISEVKSFIKQLKDIAFVSSHTDSINEAIKCYKTKNIKACNVLLITVIEGLVRGLGCELVKQQQLQINPNDKHKYASLERFLSKIPWKKDLEIKEIKYNLLTGDYSLQKSDIDKILIINLNERLGFLNRRFKETRNVILHGEKTDYANPLNSYMNFSALKEVLNTISDYN